MERRYLVAALAIIATFAVFSRGFHALQRMSFDHSGNYEAVAAARCWADSAAHTVAKVRAHFHHDYSPEQAQMVAEMNMPAMESSIAEQMSRQDQAVARCARERALQQAERAQRQIMQETEHAQRDAMRIQQEYARVYAIPASAYNYSAYIPPDLGERIEKSLAEAQKQMQVAQERMAAVEVPAVDVNTQVSTTVLPNVKCKVKMPKHTVHAFQYGFTSR